MAEITRFGDTAENIVGKQDMLLISTSPFSTMFSKALSHGVFETHD